MLPLFQYAIIRDNCCGTVITISLPWYYLYWSVFKDVNYLPILKLGSVYCCISLRLG